MAPSSSVWRLQTCAASGSRGVQRPASSLGGLSWLHPSASSDSTSQGAEPKRCKVDARLPETVSKLERKIYLDMAAVMMATETTKKENCYTKWQGNTRRIASALAAPCQCTRTACQAKTLPFENVCEYVRKYHSLTEECKACLLSSAYDTAGPMPDDRKPRTAWYLLGVRVCTEALEKLLGHSPSKFYKLVHQVPDMRQGTWSVQPRDQPQRRACDQFFAELYMSAAEHLAEQQLDIDNIDDSIAHDDACGPDSVPRPASHEHSPSLDMSWDPDESLSTQMLMATAADLRSGPPRFCNMVVSTTYGGKSWLGGHLCRQPCLQQTMRSSSAPPPTLRSGELGRRSGAQSFASASLPRTHAVPNAFSTRRPSTEGQGMLHRSKP